MTTKLIPFVPATNRMKVRDRRQLRIKWIFKNDDWFVIRWHVYDTQYKWQLTDPGPSLISRPIPTAFLLLPSFILQPMKLSIFSQKLPLRGWLVLNRILWDSGVSMLMSYWQLFHFICWLLTYQFATTQTQRLSHYPTLAFSREVKLLLRVVNMKPVVTILLLIGVTFIVIVILLHHRQHSW